MLNQMLTKAKAAIHDEAVEYAKFSSWCVSEQANLKKSIASAEESIEGLSADIGELTIQANVLGKEIAKLSASVQKDEAESEAQKKQRAADYDAFVAEQSDYAESITALERAIATLQKQNYDRTALLQLSGSATLPQNAKNVIAAFVGMMNDDDTQAPPEANAYEFKSGGIVTMLKKLLTEFTAKKDEVEKEEMNSRHSSDMLLLDLKNSMDVASKTVDEKTALKQGKLAESAIRKKELAQTETTKKEDESSLTSMKTDCTEKSYSFQEKQQMRKEEIQALEKAIEILDTEEGRSGDYLLGLTQKKSGHALVQLFGSSSMDSEGIHRRVREFLFAQAKKLHSNNLNLLAQKVAADPFAKVKTMIDGMIARLEKEATEDAQHEGFCATELGKSKIAREKLTAEIDMLTGSIEEGKALLTELAQAIATLTKEVAELDASMTMATQIRGEEKARNAAAVADATAAKGATEAAIQVLKDFYAKASTATALLQVSSGKRTPIPLGGEEWNALANPSYKGTIDKGHKAGMATFGEKNTGMQASAGGVLAMMEVIISDFSEIIVETGQGEAAAAKEYTSYMEESKKNKAVKLKSLDEKGADKIATEGKVESDTADMKSTQDQLIAADKYYARLEPQCIDKGMTFDERTAARNAEVASLKEALKILGGLEA